MWADSAHSAPGTSFGASHIPWTTRVATAAAALLIAFWATAASGEGLSPQAQSVKATVVTPSGELRIEQLDALPLGHRFRIVVGKLQVLETDADDERSDFSDFPYPKLIARFEHCTFPYTQVLVFQQMAWGNACNGGPLWLLGLRSGEAPVRTETIDYCGGPTPRVRAEANGISITLPNNADGPPSKSATVTWRLVEGKLSKVTGAKTR